MTLHETRPLFDKEELKWRCRDKQLKWRCCRCGQEFYSKIDHNYANVNGYVSYVRCPVCDIRLYVKSYAELELFDSIKQIYHGDLISGDRKTIKPKEIDIMMKDISTGIEYDGIFWHSEYVGVNANKMLEKTLMCDNKGIRLIRVYSDEWLINKESVLWKIKTLISDDVHEFSDIKIVQDLDHRMLFCGEDKIGEYFLCEDFIDRIVLGEKDLNIDFLRCIVNYEKTFGVAITSFVFDRRFYSINKIARLSAKVEMLAQTRYVVHGDSMRDGVGGMRTDVRTHIWDCGYIRMII
jgi:DNA-directed RNA polymerase subunit RPC12/RpoP